MSREEAINIIKSECYIFNPLNFDRSTMINTALDKAIEALEQGSCEDCVSREEMLKQIKEWRDCEFVKMTNPYHYLEKRIQSMSSVTPARPKGY